MAELTIFYDGDCPLCSLEMRHLKAVDRHHRIDLENIRGAGFSARFPDIDFVEAVRVLHGRSANGQLLTGLEVTERAWTLVGLGPLTSPLRCSLTRPLFDRAYAQFARHRHRISRFLLAAGDCARGTPLEGWVPDEFRRAEKRSDTAPQNRDVEDDCGCGRP